MKKNLFFLMVLISYKASSQPTPFVPYPVNGVNMSSGTYSLYSGSILTPQPSTTDNFSGTSVVNFTAAQYIYLEPGFNAGGYSTGGYFLGQIGGNPITDAEVMGSTNEGYQYQRFEIGVNIEK